MIGQILIQIKLPLYAKSKTMAEKSAWEFINNLGEDEKFPLTVFCPYGFGACAFCLT